MASTWSFSGVARAMTIDVADLIAAQAGDIQGLLHSRQMLLRLGDAARPYDGHRSSRPSPAIRREPEVVSVRVWQKPAASPRTQALAVLVERAAGLVGNQLQRMKTVEYRQAQAVDAADHGRVGQPGLDQARGRSKYLGAGGAGGGNRHDRAAEAEPSGHVSTGRVRSVDPWQQKPSGEKCSPSPSSR